MYLRDIKDIVPDDKVWLGNTDESIQLYMGDKDCENKIAVTASVGDSGDVHMLQVGDNGCGNTFAIQQMVAVAARQYSPRALSMWIADFSGTEFQCCGVTPGLAKTLPQLKECLCSKEDIDVFNFFGSLSEEADKRRNTLYEAGCKSIKAYNEAIRNGKLFVSVKDGELAYANCSVNPFIDMRELGCTLQLTEDACMSRALVVLHDLDKCFENISQETRYYVENTLSYLMKYGRALGLHIVISATSTKNFPDWLVDAIPLRRVMRCDAERTMKFTESNEVNTIEETTGVAYVRALYAEDGVELTKVWIPELSIDKVYENIDELSRRAEQEGILSYKTVCYGMENVPVSSGD